MHKNELELIYLQGRTIPTSRLTSSGWDWESETPCDETNKQSRCGLNQQAHNATRPTCNTTCDPSHLQVATLLAHNVFFLQQLAHNVVWIGILGIVFHLTVPDRRSVS